MERKNLKDYDLPDSPGVYYFKDREEILYIGKATSLKDRVASYFNNDVIASRGPRIVDMVTKATNLSWEATDSVLEALILEALEIKKYQPAYNVKEKDDKSYVYAVVTNEEWPRVLAVRGKEIGTSFDASLIKQQYGPFPSSMSLRKGLDIIRKIFPFYDTKKPVTEAGKHEKANMEFNRQLDRYPRDISHEEYLRNIRHINLFLSGKKKQLLQELERLMNSLAKEERFEEAERAKTQVFALNHIQDVSLIRDDLRRTHGIRIEAYDIAHTAGSETVGMMVVLEDGELQNSEFRKFIIREHANNDTGSLKELLERRFSHPEWPYPKLMVIDGGKGQKNTAEKVLKELGLEIPIVSIVKDEHHRPRQILGREHLRMVPEQDVLLANAAVHKKVLAFHRSRRDKTY